MSNGFTEQKAIQAKHMVHITNYWGVSIWRRESKPQFKNSMWTGGGKKEELLPNLEEWPQVKGSFFTKKQGLNFNQSSQSEESLSKPEKTKGW